MTAEQLGDRELRYRQRRNLEDLEDILGVPVQARRDSELGRTLFAAAGVVVWIDDDFVTRTAASSRSIAIGRRINEAIAATEGLEARRRAIRKHPDLRTLGHALQRAVLENA